MSNKTKIIISFSILFIAVIVLYIITLLDVEPYAIQESSYIGVLVTIMGIIFTILVGYQIFNKIEIKEQIHDIKKKEKEIAEAQQQLEDFAFVTKASATSARALVALTNKEFDSSISLSLKAIKEFLQVKELNAAMKDINIEMANLKLSLNSCKSIADERIEIINDTINCIFSTANYSFISNQFQSILIQLNKINDKIITKQRLYNRIN